ncbi:MAG TPA: arginase [Deinococcales bacterium]|nr:arginase [Deinococcales bacterium]
MKVAILGVPMDLGAGRRGVDMGPSAIRYARLAETLVALGHDVEDLGNVTVPVLEAITPGSVPADSGLPYLEAIRAACQEAAERLHALSEGVFPIAIGGDHSMSMGTVAGAARGERSGLIWVDAHTDFNVPETSPGGNIHGMPVAHLVGLGDPRLVDVGGQGATLRAEDIVMIGIRSVDTGERALLREAGATVITMKDVDRLGIPRVLDETLERLEGVSRLHLSFDADAIDPTFAPGVGTPVPGGLTYREAHLVMELLADSGRVTSLDLVEVNPILDRENSTARIMVEMASSLLGKTIL